jgi:hypothetical protein
MRTIYALAGDAAPLYEATGIHIVTLEHNEIVTGINFGNWIEPPGEIHGYKWNDLDGDGVWDQPDEPALAGWLIYLDANTNGALDGGEQWTTTATDGSYSFTNLPAGTHYVAELKAPGWTQTNPSSPHHETERLYVMRGSGTTAVINELDPETFGVISSFAAPTGTATNVQGLAVGPHSYALRAGSGYGCHTRCRRDR